MPKLTPEEYTRLHGQQKAGPPSGYDHGQRPKPGMAERIREATTRKRAAK